MSGSLFIRLINAFAFPDPEPPAINIMYGWSGVSSHFGLSFYVFFCNIIKVKHFRIVLLYCYIWFFLSYILNLYSSYMHVSIKSIDCILLSSSELKAILLITSVKTICFSFLNLCCVFDISLFFMNSFFFFEMVYFIFNLRCF